MGLPSIPFPLFGAQHANEMKEEEGKKMTSRDGKLEAGPYSVDKQCKERYLPC